MTRKILFAVVAMLLLTGEAEETINEDGFVIQAVPLWKWLLE